MIKNNDERKNYRFPMFSDTAAVKQVDDYTRVILQEEYPMDLSDEGNVTSEMASDSNDNEFEFYEEGTGQLNDKFELRGSDFSDYELSDQIEFDYVADVNNDSEASQVEQSYKPDFTTGHKPSFQKAPIDHAFYEPVKPAKTTVKATDHEFYSEAPQSNERETSLHNRFTPKYIPESHNRSFEALAKEQKNKDKLLIRFDKSVESYILLEDVEETPEEVDQPTEVFESTKPSFKRDTTDIPFTRREFKKLSEKEKEKVELPSEGQEKALSSGRGNRLDRGLQGLLDEEPGAKSLTRYFE